MVRNEILKLNVNKSCGPEEIHLQILIELVDLVSKPLALLLKKNHRLRMYTAGLENGVRFTNI